MEVAPSSNAAMQWLSELGMDDPALVRHLDSLYKPVDQVAPMASACNSFDLVGAFKARDVKPFATNHMFNQPTFPSMDAFSHPERPSKMLKPSPWEDLSYVGKSSMPQPVAFQRARQHQFYQQPHQQLHHLQQHTNQHHSLSQQLHMQAFGAKMRDEIQETGAPRTPSTQPELGGSPGSAVLDSVTEGISHETLSSGAPRGEMPLSPTESIRGRHKPEVYNPDLNVLRVNAEVKAPAVPTKGSGHTQDHIMAERKRREKLSQRFIALSAIVPGLKKMDKASVLGDAIKYVKQLQERLKTMEEQAPKRVRSVSSVRLIAASCKEAKSSTTEDVAGESEEISDVTEQPPEIEARMIDKNVLIRIHCEKKKGLLPKALAELENLQLVVMNANILSFTETSHELTFSAQMEDGCEMSADDIVTSLQSLLKTAV